MVEKILNSTTPYGKIRASHEGSLHSSTLKCFFTEVGVVLGTGYVYSFQGTLT